MALQRIVTWQAVVYLIFLIFLFVLYGTLALLVSRRRSKTAMWVSIAMFALGLPVFVQTNTRGQLLGSDIIAALQGIGQAVAYGLLFIPSARWWVGRETRGCMPSLIDR